MTEKEVERAIFITISAGIACWLTTYITIGTIMAPPPIPNNPAKNPVIHPTIRNSKIISITKYS